MLQVYLFYFAKLRENTYLPMHHILQISVHNYGTKYVRGVNEMLHAKGKTLSVFFFVVVLIGIRQLILQLL